MSVLRIEQLTFTRFIAAISIVVLHYGLGVFPFTIDALHTVFEVAFLGVSYFFVLSGFVLMLAYQHKKHIFYKEFMRNRIARIYPIYLVALLLTIAASIQQQKIHLLDIIINVFLAQSWVPSRVTALNGPSWALSVEFFFYLLFPLLYNYVYTHAKRTKILAYGTVFLWAIYFVGTELFVRSHYFKPWPDPSYTFIYYFPLLHLGEFLLGNITGYYFLQYFKNTKKNVDIALIVYIAIMLLYVCIPTSLDHRNGFFSILFVPFIVLMCINTGYITKICTRKNAIILGELSFAIYMLQDPIWYWFKDAFLGRYIHFFDNTINFYGTSMVLLLVSFLLYTYLEKPARNYIRAFSLQKK